MGFGLTSSADDGVTVMTVSGDVDISNSEQLRGELLSTLSAGAGRVVIDLRAVTFLDSTGLGALAAGIDPADESGAHITVVSPPELRRLFTITGLDSALDVVDDLDAGLQTNTDPA